MNHPGNISRRSALRRIGQLAAGAALATIAFVLGKRTSLPSHDCTGQFICRGCPSLDPCVLPQALSLKNALKEGQPRG